MEYFPFGCVINQPGIEYCIQPQPGCCESDGKWSENRRYILTLQDELSNAASFEGLNVEILDHIYLIQS